MTTRGTKRSLKMNRQETDVSVAPSTGMPRQVTGLSVAPSTYIIDPSVCNQTWCHDGSTSFRLEPRERRMLNILAFFLGFGQGCGACFYVGAGGYYVALFNDPSYLIYHCAFFYVPPIVVSVSAILFDRAFDVKHGVRVALKCRIFFSGFAISSLLVVICLVTSFYCSPLTTGRAYGGEGALICAVGAILGIFCSTLISASCALVGTVDVGTVPCTILGSCSSGVFTSLVARCIGLSPDREMWRLQVYFFIPTACVLFSLGLFVGFNRTAVLERSYQLHEQILASSSDTRAIAAASDTTSESEGRLNMQLALARQHTAGSVARQVTPRSRAPLSIDVHSAKDSSRDCAGFPFLCWSMAACQSFALGMNMSLTPLAGQVAQGDFAFTQALVLTKMLSDFVGRVAFFFLPIPQRGARRWSLNCVEAHAWAAWFVELLRLPLWLAVYARARNIQLPLVTDLTTDDTVLLWMIWLPLIASGTISSSWCSVVAIVAAAESQRSSANTLMASSFYAGMSLGIFFALVF